MSGSTPGPIGSRRAAVIGSSIRARGLPGRLAQHSVTNHRGKLLRRRIQQCHRLGGRETAEAVLRQPGIDEQRWVTLAHGGQQHDRIGLQAAGDKRKHFRGGAVKPLRILGQDQQWCLGRDLT